MPFDVSQFWVISIIAPAILLIVLIWLVIKVRSNRPGPLNREAEEGTREVYGEEEERRREGTDKAEK
jgi:signal transduction histidine kinase